MTEFDARTAPNEELASALMLQADTLKYWLTWNKRVREQEDLSAIDGTAVVAIPPHWPTRAMLRIWADTMNEAALRLQQADNG